MLRDRLKTLRPETLKALADYYSDMAEDCAMIGARKSGRAERRTYLNRKAAILMTADLVRARSHAVSLDRAIAQVAQETGLPQASVLASYRHSQRQRESRAR